MTQKMPSFEIVGIVHIGGKRVAVIIDLDNDDFAPSVTNTIDRVAKKIGVDVVIYKDTIGRFDLWATDRGFISLGGAKSTEQAIEAAKMILE